MEAIVKSLLIFLIIPFSLFAQYTLNLDQNTLVNSSQLGEDLLLFVPDSTVQILRNPARAAGYENNFFFVTRHGYNYSTLAALSVLASSYPDLIIENSIGYRRKVSQTSPILYTTNVPAINITYLFGANKKKWLLKISSSTKNDEKSFAKDKVTNNVFTTENRTKKNTDERMSNIYLNQFSLYKVGKASFANYSIGIKAGMDINSNKIIKTVSDKSEAYLDTRFLQRTVNSSAETNNRINKYFAGAEFTLSDANWDLLSSITYQKTDFRLESKKDDREQYFDTEVNNPQSTNYSTKRDFEYFNIQNSKPDIFHLQSYYQQKAKLITENDNFFIHINGFYTNENRKYDYSKSFDEEKVREDSVYYSDSGTISNRGDVDLKNWFLDIAAGYVVKHKVDDLYLLAGLISSYSYVNAEKVLFFRSSNIDDSVNPVENRIENVSHFKVPIYINYIPTNWFELNGGYIMHYLYKNSETTFKNSSVVGSERDFYTNSFNNLESFNSIFFGMNLKHKSGLRIQVAFNNSLTSYSRWDLSLGYLY
jgi:hypothetical protein